MNTRKHNENTSDRALNHWCNNFLKSYHLNTLNWIELNCSELGLFEFLQRNLRNLNLILYTCLCVPPDSLSWYDDVWRCLCLVINSNIGSHCIASNRQLPSYFITVHPSTAITWKALIRFFKTFFKILNLYIH